MGPAIQVAIVMNEEYYKELNAQLGFEFDLFAIEHTAWVQKHVPTGAVVVMQTDDPAFNAWARRMVERTRRQDDEPNRPMVLVHIRKLRPQRSRIVSAEAELVTEVKPRRNGKNRGRRRAQHSTKTD